MFREIKIFNLKRNITSTLMVTLTSDDREGTPRSYISTVSTMRPLSVISIASRSKGVKLVITPVVELMVKFSLK